MLTQLTNWALVCVVGLLFALSLYTKHLSSSLLEARENYGAAVIKLQECSRSVQIVSKSCEITETLNQQLDSKNAQLASTIEQLLEDAESVPITVLVPTPSYPTTTETPHATPQNKGDSGDVRLSPDVMLLLNRAYCSASGDESYCTTK